jgi:hypothetical protein
LGETCRGFNQHVATAVGTATAHQVVALEVAKQLDLVCLKRGSYGLTHLVNLRQRCRGTASIFGQRARRTLLQGRLRKGHGKAGYVCRASGHARAGGVATSEALINFVDRMLEVPLKVCLAVQVLATLGLA